MTNDIFKDKNLVKFREYTSVQHQQGNQFKRFTFEDEGNGFKSKIFEDDLNETHITDKILKLKGNYYVLGTNKKYVNVFQCIDLCDEGYQLIPIYESNVKISKYDENGIPYDIQKIPIVGKCFCKKFDQKITKKLEEEFESPFGTFSFKLNAEHENQNNIEFSKFQNQKNGKYFGDSNFDQTGKNKIEISANFKPKNTKNVYNYSINQNKN
eukprot:gene9869-2191_t